MRSFYYSYRVHLKKKFGTDVYKIPVNAGFSCPNRDGTVGTAGCAFCDNNAFSPAAACRESTAEQVMRAMTRSKRADRKYIVYLQPFSNTYGSVERLRAVYEPLLTIPGVVGLAVGTRPDCVTEEIADYLADVAGKTYLSVELGLQSSHDATLALVNRGHRYEDFVKAVKQLHERNIETVAHIMLGLPGEGETMMFETADRIAVLPVTGVKIHQLMVIRGTAIEQMFAEGKASALSLDEYSPLLAGFISRLRPDLHIHRIMADTRLEHGLLAPLWSADKAGSVQVLQEYLRAHAGFQGSMWTGRGVLR